METPSDAIASKRSFYWECLKLAGRGTWGVTGDIATFLGIVTAIFWHFEPGLWNNPAVIAKVNDWDGIYLLIVPLAALSTVRLLLAPYWIYQEARRKNVSKLAELNTELDAFRGAKQKVHASLADFVRLGREMRTLYSERAVSYPLWQIGEVNQWQDRVEAYLKANGLNLASSEFENVPGNGGEMLLDENYQGRLEASKLSGQIEVLANIAKNLDQFMPQP